MSLTTEQGEQIEKWLEYYYPRLAATDGNGAIIGKHIFEFHRGNFSEFALRDAIFVNKRILTWLPEDIHVEDPRDTLARQQAEAAKKVADAEAAKVAAEAARVKAEKKQAREDAEWRSTHKDLLGSSRRNADSEHAQAEQKRIADAKATFQAATEITNAMLQKEINATINGYTKQNPVTQHIDHPGTAKLRAELRSISVLNNGKPDYARQLALVRQAIKRLP